LTNGRTYYLPRFAHDEVPNYSIFSDGQRDSRGGGGFCFQDDFNYPDGALVGLGGWTGTATVSHIEVVTLFVRVYGGSSSKNAIKSINCSLGSARVHLGQAAGLSGDGDLHDVERVDQRRKRQ
jgi:hypothetical protein